MGMRLNLVRWKCAKEMQGRKKSEKKTNKNLQ